jgi:Enoyl-CoA hydratase/carnithine racemase
MSFLDNMTHVKDLIVYFIKREQIKYVVTYSMNKGIWSLGGDLEFFVNCIRNNKREELREYAYKCVDILHAYNNNYELDVFSTCVVQGNAYGGGGESALSGNYVLAERSAKFSFPEVIFGAFPGMGAYSFLTKKVGFNKAEEIIKSGKLFTAEEIHSMGIIDEVCEDGFGIATIAERIRNGDLEKYVSNPFLSICNKVSKEELIHVVNLWIEKAFELEESNLNRMVRLAGMQQRKMDKT